MKSKKLEELSKIASTCTKCKLSTTRTNVVFGEGNPEAELMFIGEGPGKQEDLTGRPFIGKAGDVLTRLIEVGMQVPRSKVYIANITKCRPTINLQMVKDRPPDTEETKACSPYLVQQIEIIQPKVIVTLGNPSTKFLLNTADGITKIRGQWFEYNSIPVLPTYHPSYILRNNTEVIKKDVWEDFQKVMEKLNWPIKTKIKWKENGE